MKKLIKNIGYIIAIVSIAIGMYLSEDAKSEMSNNFWYTFKPPYTQYEARVVMTRGIGIFLIVAGLIFIGLNTWKRIYTNKHMQDINQLTKAGGSIKCTDCGLVVSANVDICPRCGKNIVNGSANKLEYGITHFCGKCGNKVNAGETFCPYCGNKINN